MILLIRAASFALSRERKAVNTVTKIKKDGRYIRRADIGADGQPTAGAKPVKILTTTLEGEHCVAYQVDGGIKRVNTLGRRFTEGTDSEEDIFPWPKAPVYYPWDSVKEVPLEARFRNKESDRYSFRESGVNVIGDEIKIDGGWYSMQNLNLSCEYSIDNGVTWMPCGKLKATPEAEEAQ